MCVFAWRGERNKEMLLCIGVAQLRANVGKIQQSRRWKNAEGLYVWKTNWCGVGEMTLGRNTSV